MHRKISFSIPMKVFSVNRATYRDARFKTQEFKDWATEMLVHLRDLKELYEISDDFKQSTGDAYFTMHLSAIYPPHIFYNKQRQISSKTIDITNFEKPFCDLVFRDVMDINDKYLVQLTSSKRVGVWHTIQVELELYTDQ